MKTLATKRLLAEHGGASEAVEAQVKWHMLQQVSVPMTVKIPWPSSINSALMKDT